MDHSLTLEVNLHIYFCFRKTGYKKKLNSFIQFPDILSMEDHIKNGYLGMNHCLLLKKINNDFNIKLIMTFNIM